MEIDVERLICNGQKCEKEDKIKMVMNFVENELEIHFSDRDKDDGKDVLCKLELPFND